MNNKLTYAILILVVIIGVYFASTSLSTIGSTPETISDCRIVLEGDVCIDYEDCLYGAERDVSCIRGYKIVGEPEGEPELEFGQELAGGSSE